MAIMKMRRYTFIILCIGEQNAFGAERKKSIIGEVCWEISKKIPVK